MRVAIFGANGPTGRLLTGQALAAGHQVIAVTRHPGGVTWTTRLRPNAALHGLPLQRTGKRGRPG